MKILAIWITKGLFIFVVCIAEWNVCSNLGIHNVIKVDLGLLIASEHKVYPEIVFYVSATEYYQLVWNTEANVLCVNYYDGTKWTALATK